MINLPFAKRGSAATDIIERRGQAILSPWSEGKVLYNEREGLNKKLKFF
jgi:hypothetical protein